MDKGVVVDLLDEEIRHVGARDEPTCPIGQPTRFRSNTIGYLHAGDLDPAAPTRSLCAAFTSLAASIAVVQPRRGSLG